MVQWPRHIQSRITTLHLVSGLSRFKNPRLRVLGKCRGQRSERNGSKMATAHELHTHDEEKTPPAGSRVVAVSIDGSAQSLYALDFYVNNMWTPNDYVVVITIPELDKVVQETWDDALFQFSSARLKTLMEEQKVKVNKDLEKARETLLSKKIRGKVRAIFSQTPGDAICRAAEEEKALFIVMGSRGHGMFRKTATGSVSNYVINHSKIPVMVCRK